MSLDTLLPNDGPAFDEAPAARLEAVADTLRLSPLLHFRAELAASFAVHIDSRRRAPLYLLQGAPLRVRHAASGWRATLHDGDLLFLPRAGEHELRGGDDDGRCLAFEQLLDGGYSSRRHTFELRQPQPVRTLFGSFFATAELVAQPLLGGLPPVVHLRGGDDTTAPWLAPLRALMRWMVDLRQGGGVGMQEVASTLVRHLALAQARARLDATPGAAAAATGAAGGFDDPRIGPALQAIHLQPERDWSVEALAALCHLSRTRFAFRFAVATGQAPMRYLAAWRIGVAERLLRDKRLTLDQVAQATGYSSGLALSKAFKRCTGRSPSGRSARRD